MTGEEDNDPNMQNHLGVTPTTAMKTRKGILERR